LAASLTFTKKFGIENPNVDLIFIHGLTGDPEKTWMTDDDSEFWPNWLEEAFPKLGVYSLGYPASLFQKWASKEMDIYERATSALDIMASHGIGERPLIFIVHSLGGILLKQILRTSNDSTDEDYTAIGESVNLAVFLSTPHTGASLASLMSFVFPKLKSPHIDLLTKDNGALFELNNHYRSFSENHPDFRTVVYYEKHLTKNVSLVVDRTSADPGVSGTRPVAVDKDHINICKPANKNDVVYTALLRHIRKVMKKHEGSASDGVQSAHGEAYEKTSESDRRTLLNKMIDADREHEYSIANDYQNKFARAFYKYGLYTPERNDHDNLLSQIQQRFVTHIYLPLICKGAEESAIQDALQLKVIDPIVGTKIGSTKFNAKEVLNALYFLTEKCHVRWDAETC